MPPKLQTACTLTAQDGMVVKTARTSRMAAEAQNATLEFILVNHPLDCPVCDKGGECPLQDLTFRYGPGNTRMSFEKQTFEKPIPISPTISLDRERCILCYRCTRFSSDVSEDGQLVAANRGAMSVITTFEDLPYTGAFTGNVTELCPVGALLPTQYRFEGRPWEIVDVPDRLRALPRRLQHQRDRPRGEGQADPLPQPPRDRRGLDLRQGPLRVHAPARRRPAHRAARRHAARLEPVSWEEAVDEAERLLRRGARPHRHRALGLGDGRAGVRARRSCCAGASTRTRRCCRRRSPARSTGSGCRCRRSATPTWSSSSATCRSSSARRSSTSGSRRRGATARGSSTPSTSVGEAERIVLVWSGPGGHGGATVAELAEKLGLAERDGCGAFYLPETPNGRGVADAWAACCDDEAAEPESIGVLVVSGDEAAANANVRALAEQAEATIVISMFGARRRLGPDLLLPGTSYLERDGTFVNLEGRLQRLRRTVTPPCPDELEWIAELAARFDVDVAPYAAGVFGEVSAKVYGGLSLRRGRRARAAARLSRRAASASSAALPAAEPKREARARSGSSRTSRSSPAPPSSASPSSSSSGRSPSSSSRPTTRGGAGSRPATWSRSGRTAARSRCRRASTGACARASRASRSSTRTASAGIVELSRTGSTEVIAS